MNFKIFDTVRLHQAQQQEESGRSMVEMLGVLAIICVLSIGGVIGFKYGITKYKTNETTHELNMRAVSYAHQIRNGNNTLVSELGSKTGLGYSVDAFVCALDECFKIRVSGVPSTVCEKLVADYIVPIQVYVNNQDADLTEDNLCGTGDNVSMMFVYDKNLDLARSDAEDDYVSNSDNKPEETRTHGMDDVSDPMTDSHNDVTTAPPPGDTTTLNYVTTYDITMTPPPPGDTTTLNYVTTVTFDQPIKKCNMSFTDICISPEKMNGPAEQYCSSLGLMAMTYADVTTLDKDKNFEEAYYVFVKEGTAAFGGHYKGQHYRSDISDYDQNLDRAHILCKKLSQIRFYL